MELTLFINLFPFFLNVNTYTYIHVNQPIYISTIIQLIWIFLNNPCTIYRVINNITKMLIFFFLENFHFPLFLFRRATVEEERNVNKNYFTLIELGHKNIFSYR